MENVKITAWLCLNFFKHFLSFNIHYHSNLTQLIQQRNVPIFFQHRCNVKVQGKGNYRPKHIREGRFFHVDISMYFSKFVTEKFFYNICESLVF